MDLRQRIRKYITNPLKKLIYPLFGYKLISYRKHTDRCIFASKKHILTHNQNGIEYVKFKKIEEDEKPAIYEKMMTGKSLHSIRYSKDRILEVKTFGNKKNDN